MELLINSTPYDVLKRKATYEIIVASLRGLGSMIGFEGQVSTYYDKLFQFTTPSDLEDATALWTYCYGAYHHNAVQVTLEDLSKWRSNIYEIIASELKTANQPGKRCLLLETLGFLIRFQNQDKKISLQ